MTGPELRAARRRLRLSQRALAAVLGVPQKTLWRWENGAHPIEHGPILRLALERLAQTSAP